MLIVRDVQIHEIQESVIIIKEQLMYCTKIFVVELFEPLIRFTRSQSENENN